MKAYIYSTSIPASERILIGTEKAPGTSSIPIAITFVTETVMPASLRAAAATSGLSTIIRRIPKSVVSAIERALMLAPALTKY